MINDPTEPTSRAIRPAATPILPERWLPTGVAPLSWQRLLRLAQHPTGVVGMLIVVVYLFLALFGDMLAPYPATQQHLTDTLLSPSAQYWFGTDQFGRDVFSRVLSGTRSILVLATSATALALLLGVTVGLMAGYSGGFWDELLMRIADVLLAFPALLLALLIVSTLGTGQVYLVLCIGVVFAPGIARVVRSVVLDLKTREFIDAARLRGESSAYIMFREILPNAGGPILVDAAIYFGYAILLGSGLGFLGMGVQPPSPDWGLQVNEGRNFILTAPWVIGFPSLAIATLVLGVNLLADGLASALGIDLPEGSI